MNLYNFYLRGQKWANEKIELGIDRKNLSLIFRSCLEKRYSTDDRTKDEFYRGACDTFNEEMYRRDTGRNDYYLRFFRG